MGAFFLYHRDTEVSESKLDEVYFRKGFSDPVITRLGNYTLRLYRKQIINIDNYFKKDSHSIYAIGSLTYRKQSYRNSLELLLKDYIANTISSKELLGNYVLIFHEESKKESIKVFIDPSFFKNVYFGLNVKVISTDFLAIVYSINQKLTLNKLAVIENLITGCLISPDTYFKEIEKIDTVNLKHLSDLYSEIIFEKFQPGISTELNSRKEAIEHANKLLSEYFESTSEICNEYGAHIGLTGGFDSRLLLMALKGRTKRLITNSFWRINSSEYKNAKGLAQKAKLDFFSFEDEIFKGPEEKEMLESSFFFFDGQIRSQNRWNEVFNQPEYCSRISQKHFVGFHGCGGEQYRNADHLIRSRNFRNYIQYHWMFKQCRDSFIDKKVKKKIQDHIGGKIQRLLGMEIEKIDLYLHKRIQNEIWNQANRNTRVNLLNQQQFYFAPFTEIIISHNAYNYIPFLGSSFSFQIDMMKKLDIDLLSAPSNYGFDLTGGEPFRNSILVFFANFLPDKLFNWMYFKFRKLQNNYYEELLFQKEKHNLFSEISDDIDLNVLLKNNNLSAGLVSMNYFLNKISDHFNYE